MYPVLISYLLEGMKGSTSCFFFQKWSRWGGGDVDLVEMRMFHRSVGGEDETS